MNKQLDQASETFWQARSFLHLLTHAVPVDTQSRVILSNEPLHGSLSALADMIGTGVRLMKQGAPSVEAMHRDPVEEAMTSASRGEAMCWLLAEAAGAGNPRDIATDADQLMAFAGLVAGMLTHAETILAATYRQPDQPLMKVAA